MTLVSMEESLKSQINKIPPKLAFHDE